MSSSFVTFRNAVDDAKLVEISHLLRWIVQCFVETSTSTELENECWELSVNTHTECLNHIWMRSEIPVDALDV